MDIEHVGQDGECSAAFFPVTHWASRWAEPALRMDWPATHDEKVKKRPEVSRVRSNFQENAAHVT